MDYGELHKVDHVAHVFCLSYRDFDVAALAKKLINRRMGDATISPANAIKPLLCFALYINGS